MIYCKCKVSENRRHKMSYELLNFIYITQENVNVRKKKYKFMLIHIRSVWTVKKFKLFISSGLFQRLFQWKYLRNTLYVVSLHVFNTRCQSKSNDRHLNSSLRTGLTFQQLLWYIFTYPSKKLELKGIAASSGFKKGFSFQGCHMMYKEGSFVEAVLGPTKMFLRWFMLHDKEMGRRWFKALTPNRVAYVHIWFPSRPRLQANDNGRAFISVKAKKRNNS